MSKRNEGMEKVIREGNHVAFTKESYKESYNESYKEGDYFIENDIKWVVTNVKKTKEGIKITLEKSK